MTKNAIFFISFWLVTGATAFSPIHSRVRQPTAALLAKKSKGFGKQQSTTPPARPVETDAAPKQQIENINDTVQKAAAVEAPLSGGQQALANLRRQQAESKDAELRRVREMLQADQQVQETAAAIPEKVAQRMGKRMLPFVGIPLFLGMGTFVGFWYMATYRDLEYQPALVAASTIFVLVVGLLGITYSVMSTSWDEDREGDLLGTTEFKTNIQNIRDGLNRSRENALLREKMGGLADGELDRAMSDLERREAAQQRRSQTLNDKLNE